MKDGWLYEMAQWYPRSAVYDDVNGWQTDQFLGQGEFYLNFGNYDVSLTVPHDHIVQGTGVIVNPAEVLTATQRSRLAEAFTSETPKFIITAEEVMTPGTRPAGTAPLTWHFKAENVRDFAWASSKTFVWDAAGFKYKPDAEADRDALAVSAGRDAAVGQGVDQGDHPDDEELWADGVPVPVSRRRRTSTGRSSAWSTR